MILENPFRRLGLPATATAREIRRRLADLEVDASLGDAPPGLDADGLRELRQSLDDPVQRLRHELFWVHVEGLDADALAKTAAGPQGREQAIALHALAVLASERQELGGPAGAEPLGRWADVHRSDPFWTYMEGRAAAAADARATAQVVARLRDEWPATVLEPLTLQALALLKDGRLREARPWFARIRDSGFPAPAVEAAIRTAAAPMTSALRRGTEDAVEQIGRAASAPSDGTLARAQEVLVDDVLAPFAYLRACAVVDDADADAAAAAAQRLGDVSGDVYGDWLRSVVVLGQAMAVASAAELTDLLEERQAAARGELHGQYATVAYEQAHMAYAAAHADLAVEFTAQEGRRMHWRALGRRARDEARVRERRVQARTREIEAALERRAEALRDTVRDASGGYSADAAPPPPPAPRKPGIGLDLDALRRESVRGRLRLGAREQPRWARIVLAIAIPMVVLSQVARIIWDDPPPPRPSYPTVTPWWETTPAAPELPDLLYITPTPTSDPELLLPLDPPEELDIPLEPQEDRR